MKIRRKGEIYDILWILAITALLLLDWLGLDGRLACKGYEVTKDAAIRTLNGGTEIELSVCPKCYGHATRRVYLWAHPLSVTIAA